MEPEKHIYCSASMCKLPILKGELYHRFWKSKVWKDRLLGDGSEGFVVCHRHFSPKQYINSNRTELKENAVPDQRILCCRFCLDLSFGMVRILPAAAPDSDSISLQDIIETMGIRINPEEDGIPSLICLTCATKVRYIKRIQRQFQESDRKMLQIIQNWKQENQRELKKQHETIQPVLKQYSSKAAKTAKTTKRKISPPKPPDGMTKLTPTTTTADVAFAIVNRVEVKSEQGVLTEEIVDSSGSVYTIETLDAIDEEHEDTGNDEDPLGQLPQQQLMNNGDNSNHLLPAKKIKVDNIKEETLDYEIGD